MACDPIVGGPDCWDITHDPFVVSADRWVSSPTSFKLSGVPPKLVQLHCAYEPACYLHQGRISTWYWGDHQANRVMYHFRLPTAPGNVTFKNYYRVMPFPAGAAHKVILQEIVDAAVVREWDEPYVFPAINTWHHQRLTWYKSFGNLVVDFEYETVGAWHPICDPFTVANPLFEDETYARPGIRAQLSGGSVLYIDDTEISAYE